jgi:PAS domain S-box-containing protein
MEIPDLQAEHLGKYFFNLAERSQDVFWIRSADYKTQLYISPAYEKIWGKSCRSLYENPGSWMESVFSDDKAYVEKEIQRIHGEMGVQDSYHLSYRIVHSGQDIRWIQEIGFPLFGADSRCFGYAGIAKDVTQEKQRISDLETASRFFHFFAEKIKSVFWVRDPKCNKQLYVSPAYEKIWGRSCESLYTNPNAWVETLAPEDRQGEHVSSVRLQLLEELGPTIHYDSRYQIVRPDGARVWIKDTSFPIHDHQDRFIGFAGIAEDVTEEVLYEQELRDAKQKAELANRVKSEFLATMSHELRTPLNAILGMAQILRLKGLPNELEEYVDTITHAGNSLLSLVNDVLDFARLEAGKLSLTTESFNLRLLVSQVIQSVSYQAKEKEVLLQTHFARGLPTQVLGDARRIRQVLLNLLSNAIKFTEKGSVKVQVSCFKKTKTEVLICIAVKDTGMGISEDKLDFIFEKFSQIDSAYNRKHQGIGLGLAITKELVEKMDGLITVKSKVGKGSEFGFTLPLQIDQQKKLPLKQKSLKQDKKKKIKALVSALKILVVEDNPVNQRIAKILLEEQGCEVSIAGDGAAALKLLFSDKAFSLIFMDIGLPDSNGFDIVKKIREYEPLKQIPIIAMTAHILERDKDRCFAVGMNDIIAKPILQEQLIDILHRVVAG